MYIYICIYVYIGHLFTPFVGGPCTLGLTTFRACLSGPTSGQTLMPRLNEVSWGWEPKYEKLRKHPSVLFRIFNAWSHV